MKDWIKKLKPYFPYLAALIAGGAFPFGFAPFGMATATITAIIILLACLAHTNWRQAFWVGLCFGIGMFGVGASWIYASIHDYGYAAPWLATTITALFVLILALFPAAQMGSLVRLFPNNQLRRTLLAFPTWWVIFEIFRGWFLTGFPWLYVGYAQIENRLSSFAPIGGVFLVSFFSVLLAAGLYALIDYFYHQKRKPKLRNGLIVLIVGIWVAAFAAHQIPFNAPTSQTLRVALIQGNVPQLLRWDPTALSNIIARYRLATLASSQADLIVWPESAIPLPLPLSGKIFAEMDSMLQARNVGLIAGVPTRLPNEDIYYNTLIGVGAARGVYHKHHLVPFGEYVPLERLLRGLIGFFDLPMSAFIGGPADQKHLTLGPYRFAPAICYEIAYPFYVQAMSKQANAILTVSNDTWFGRTIGPAQHLQIAQFRALENGIPVIRATNTGITALIDGKGDITALAPQFEEAVLKGDIRIRQGQTLWTQLGMWPWLIFYAALFGIAVFVRKLR